MRILVVSDTHGQRREIEEVIKKTKPFDFLIHAGDAEGREEDIRQLAGCPSLIVKGNNDYYTECSYDEVLELGGHRFFVTHGHRYSISWDKEGVKAAALENECDIAICGHTHRPWIDDSDERITIINPGSLAYPRQEGRLPSYIMIDIDRFGDAHYSLNYLERGPGKKTRWFF